MKPRTTADVRLRESRAHGRFFVGAQPIPYSALATHRKAPGLPFEHHLTRVPCHLDAELGDRLGRVDAENLGLSRYGIANEDGRRELPDEADYGRPSTPRTSLRGSG